MYKMFGLIMVICLFVSGCTTVGKQTIPVYVYHQFPPFVNPHQIDLSEAFVQRLNQTTNYHWQLVTLSRAQLNDLRQQGGQGVILWTNPKWFDNSADLLVSKPILLDADVLTFNLKQPLEGEYPAAILNKTFCAVKGHRYLAVDPYIDSGAVKVIERETHAACMALLRNQTVDFIQAEKSNLFTAYSQILASEINFLEPAIDNFQRFVLLDKSFEFALAPVNQLITALGKDPVWQQELAQFGESRFVDLFDLSIDDLMRYEINTSP
jgi:polar amino acid transport system substrate-binding protein